MTTKTSAGRHRTTNGTPTIPLSNNVGKTTININKPPIWEWFIPPIYIYLWWFGGWFVALFYPRWEKIRSAVQTFRQRTHLSLSSFLAAAHFPCVAKKAFNWGCERCTLVNITIAGPHLCSPKYFIGFFYGFDQSQMTGPHWNQHSTMLCCSIDSLQDGCTSSPSSSFWEKSTKTSRTSLQLRFHNPHLGTDMEYWAI